ncbi:MAG: hypothetical protein LUE17_06055 [Planctomycetaceae bacterium]|nr:hypothetical protein [Planctomycetaceae bacterium]
MAKPVRRSELTLCYNTQDISADIAPYLLSFDYTDVVDGKQTDSLTIVLEDTGGLWSLNWFPERGATVKASLTCHDWPGGKILDCGTFEIDALDFAGPPSTCTISALAVGITSSLRRERVSKAWDNINVREIADEVAKKHEFALEFDSDINPLIDHFDQREQSDMELLTVLCENHGLELRITDRTIVIFEQLKRDSQPPTIVFTKNANGYTHHHFRVDSADIYTACEVKYFDPTQKLPIVYRYDAEASQWSGERPPSGYVLKIHDRCTCESEAEIRAKAALREQNKREVTGTIGYVGDPGIKAGEVAALEGYGKLDAGRYLVEKAVHKRDQKGGYTTTAELRGTVGY